MQGLSSACHLQKTPEQAGTDQETPEAPALFREADGGDRRSMAFHGLQRRCRQADSIVHAYLVHAFVHMRIQRIHPQMFGTSLHMYIHIKYNGI